MNREKLVRDGIPELIAAAGGEPHVRTASDEEFRTFLLRKLAEEAAEVYAAPSIEELADVLEVLHAIANEISASWDQVEAARDAKAVARGAFSRRLLLRTEPV
ncbi:Predicted house-cleaning noncanonical NTP pyrophosphatase, all-alpha NTP-PPase (MazG) superfamily [Microbacterium azadirachtae]|uniref:Predicted house-cleaning noncanonical NTP pyrophosphatase, all-alpha NTP-PPase (MazG) superfamily n=1 Tax=Microbacterium azadirachtae TaxID=582680 RepID=A0A1I6FZY9_9MICO|nr:nucleoside triphosphate pyrophosphohydrolase [Microbacterium azadirachtae]SFR35482.1 Predicted house-cleaning noncanonical NTP pyrophosphatase, all-alpha NTP-PPase (MazG) superfamily [Microbacterium azadirachtae]